MIGPMLGAITSTTFTITTTFISTPVYLGGFSIVTGATTICLTLSGCIPIYCPMNSSTFSVFPSWIDAPSGLVLTGTATNLVYVALFYKSNL